MALFAEDWQDRVRGAFTGVTHAFPDVHITAEDMIAERNKVVLQWTFKGTHLGTFQDTPATGNEVVWTGIDIYTVMDGKITSLEREGEMSLRQQIGVVPPPEQVGE